MSDISLVQRTLIETFIIDLDNHKLYDLEEHHDKTKDKVIKISPELMEDLIMDPFNGKLIDLTFKDEEIK